MRRLLTYAGALSVTALLASGCSDTASSNSSQLSFSLASHSSVSAAAAGSAFATTSTPESFTDGSNTLVINKVELVLREIELHRSGNTAECSDGSREGCQELEFGPVLVDVPLGTPGAARNFSVQLAPGTYDKVEFEIHKPSSSDDAGFVQANPGIDGASVRVSGTYNGADFTYTGNFDAEEEFELNPPLVASEAAASDLTLFVSLDHWFRDPAGTLVDPGSANPGQPNQSLVEQNIKSSLDAFEDDDHDGSSDHGGADDGPDHQ
jgi:hypothetical protein